MNTLQFVTGNAVKFRLAQDICGPHGITLSQTALDIPEMQSEDGEPVARDKALRAFEILKTPLVVTDDTWIIPALNGFPGPYMKSINTWFTAQDWLRLTRDLDDRTIILRQIAVYQDADQQKVFTCDIDGVMLREIRGTSKHPHNTITSFDGGHQSDAELHALGKSGANDRKTVWHEVSAWLKTTRS